MWTVLLSSRPLLPIDSHFLNRLNSQVFASFAEFAYTIENPRKSSSKDEESTVNTDMVNVVVLTRTGHQEAMKELVKLIDVSS